VAVSATITFAMGAAWGITVGNEPALLAIGTIVSVAVAQLLLAGWSGAALTMRLLAVSVLVTAVYFGLHTLFANLDSEVLAPIPHGVTAGHYVLLGLVAAVFIGLSYFQAVVIHRPPAPWLLRLYVHLYNGLYTDLPVERLVYRVWPARFRDLPGRRGGLQS
jgi:hypothetical protein